MRRIRLPEQDSTTSVVVTTTRRPARKRQPRYHVILWNDDHHTYQYVIQMMRNLFGHSVEQGFQIASAVDTRGRAICLTTTREHAELKRDQIHAFGRDPLMKDCQGSMSATIEPEPAAD
ncbi:MAG: Clp protease ClpS [Planctomycetaceae bacterium]|nr:Clp protease ClpS [Planctomycetaceae bacterium]